MLTNSLYGWLPFNNEHANRMQHFLINSKNDLQHGRHKRHETKRNNEKTNDGYGFTVSGLPDVTFTSNLRLLVAWPIRF
jgi:hypothetical protein